MPRPGSPTTSRSSSSCDGDKPVVLRSTTITPLPGPGPHRRRRATLDAKHDAIAAFVAATLQAMEEIKADPTVGLDAAIKAVPELATDKDDAGGDPGRDDRDRGPARRRRRTASARSTAPAGTRRSLPRVRSGSPRPRSRPTSSSARTCCRRAAEPSRGASPAAAGGRARSGRIEYDGWLPQRPRARKSRTAQESE